MKKFLMTAAFLCGFAALPAMADPLWYVSDTVDLRAGPPTTAPRRSTASGSIILLGLKIAETCANFQPALRGLETFRLEPAIVNGRILG
jgi:hypothetical protein